MTQLVGNDQLAKRVYSLNGGACWVAGSLGSDTQLRQCSEAGAAGWTKLYDDKQVALAMKAGSGHSGRGGA